MSEETGVKKNRATEQTEWTKKKAYILAIGGRQMRRLVSWCIHHKHDQSWSKYISITLFQLGSQVRPSFCSLTGLYAKPFWDAISPLIKQGLQGLGVYFRASQSYWCVHVILAEGGSRIQGHTQLQIEFETTLSSMKPCVKMTLIIVTRKAGSEE